ncbi:hypothetical protein SP21_40 [Salmonella phage 21]|nr:hypothetical protein SP21_40 [Salmonella phage 21]
MSAIYEQHLVCLAFGTFLRSYLTCCNGVLPDTYAYNS